MSNASDNGKREENDDGVTIDDRGNVSVDLNGTTVLVSDDATIRFEINGSGSESEGCNRAEAREHFNRGRHLYDAGRYAQALEAYVRVESLDPGYGDLYFEKGKSELRLERFLSAVESFTKDVEAGAPGAMTYWNRHAAYRKLGKRTEALRDLDEALDLSPNDAEIYSGRSELRRELGDMEGSLEDARRAVELEPSNPELHHRLGRLYLLARDAKSALDAWDLALVNDPEHVGSLSGRAVLLLQAGRVDDALADLGAVVHLEPKQATHYCNRGWAFEKLGNYEHALEDYKHALELRHDYEKVHYNCAALLLRLGRKAEARRHYEELRRLGRDVDAHLLRCT